jgi:outer membrane immunogenic protein
VKIRSLLAALAAMFLGLSAASAQTWSGFYAGVSGGWGETNDIWTNTGNPDFNDVGKGTLLGIQGGYNWQFQNMVVGLESDYLFSAVKGSVVCPDPTQTCGHKLKDLGSVRGRFGWLGTPSTMMYFTGGLAWGATEWAMQDPVTGSTANGGTASHTSTGFVLGAGLEYLLAKNWSLKGEYLHYGFGSFTPAATDFGGMPPTFKFYADTYKFGLNFKF